jgi:putative ATP-dependent endonuclease of OLD family
MRINSVRLTGFRNFRDAFINLTDKSLIIGYNDVGKTNLIYALRLLLDRTLPESALDPSDSDFFVHQPTDSLRIELHLTNIVEDCLLSRFGKYITDGGDLYLAYVASRDPQSGKKNYEIQAGPADAMDTLTGRIYLKYLNLRVVEGKRDLSRFIRKERRALLEDAKDNRTQPEIDADAQLLRDVEARLRDVNSSISKLRYVSSATDSLNDELTKLSYRHAAQQLVFGTAATDPADFIEDLELVSRVADKTIGVGGDGRHNQIQLALWTA